jgi:hypothetical protein
MPSSIRLATSPLICSRPNLTNHDSPITIHESRFTNPWRAVAAGEGGTIHAYSLLDGDGDAGLHFLREADDVPIRESHTAMAD